MKSNLSQDYSIAEGIFSIKLNIPIIFFLNVKTIR
jgi:hypothetical protein